ncbi:MAG: DMT family transporter [candidate division Zixibacteria bacterium]
MSQSSACGGRENNLTGPGSENRPVNETSTGFVVGVLVFQQTMAALAFPISKYGLKIIEPFAFGFYRFIISSLVLLAINKFISHSVRIEKKDYWKIWGLGVLIIPLNQLAFLYGQSLTSSGHGAILFATTPIWIFLIAQFILKEKLIVRRAVGIVIAVIGVIVLMTGGAVELGTEFLYGDLLILLAVLTWAFYTIFGKGLVRKYGALRITAYALSSGTILYLPFGAYFASQLDYAAVSLGGWLAVLYMAIGTSVIAYGLWYWALKYMDASRMAVFHNIQPVVATVVAFFWLGEPLGIEFIIGGVIVLGGVILAEL